MVGEFPELQGIMGRYYAQHENLDDEVAYAIEDHYKPRFSGDEIPRNQVGICVALADKLETLVGLFSIGEKPTGDKDPFALRRQALGIIRLLIKANLNIKDLISLAYNVHNDFDLQKEGEINSNNNKPDTSGNNTFYSATLIQQRVLDENTESFVYSFVLERLSNMLRDQGASTLEIDAVLSLEPELLSDVAPRLEAVNTFATLPEAPALAAANKRVGNILKKIDGEVKAQIDNALLLEPQEKALAEALAKTKPEADTLFEKGDYTASLQALAALKAPVDDFFDNVMVNAEDPALKANRLGLLATLHQTMNRIADLSRLAN
jgi:glycyl-tRNA synthetase beta chain